MIDIKRNNPGITYLNSLQSSLKNEALDLASENQDFTPNKKLIENAVKSVKNNYNQCNDLNGYLSLRETIGKIVQKEYTYSYDPDEEITVTAGTSQAIATAISAFVHEGDEVILFEPAYYSYELMILANGGRPIYVQMKQPDFHIDWVDVQKVITSRTKMIIINSPHHPSGSILTAGDMEKLTKVVNGTKIIILSDESFHQLVFEGYEHQSVARFPKLAERSVIISSFEKALHIEGWKIGHCLAPAKISADFRKIHQLQVASVNAPLQIALAEFLNQYNMPDNVAQDYQTKRDIIVNGLKRSKFSFSPAKGSYFQILNYSDASEYKDIEFCKYLSDKYKIELMPLSFFFHDLTDLKSIRLCFAKADETLHKAVDILSQL
jgi:methionine transaminase